MSTKIYKSNEIIHKFSDRSCCNLGSVPLGFHLGLKQTLPCYQTFWDVSVCTTESHKKCFPTHFRLIQINFRVSHSLEEIRLYHSIKNKEEIQTKQAEVSHPKGHCQAETSALQNTPHLTVTQLEGDEDGQDRGKS